MDKIRVLIIDEKPFFRAGVHEALAQQSDFEIVDCDPGRDPLSIIEANLPDVVLLGSDLNGNGGLELGRKITRDHLNIKVVVLSPNNNDMEPFEFIKSAAVACLKKNSYMKKLSRTVRWAYRSEYQINCGPIVRPSVDWRMSGKSQNMLAIGKSMEPYAAALTHRETQILKFVANGNTNKQIAVSLWISEQTIKSHISAILRKLHANDRAHAVALAMSNGWLSVERKHEDMTVVYPEKLEAASCKVVSYNAN